MCPPSDHPDTAPEAAKAEAPPPTLLAIDLGLRMGIAVYGEDGRLVRYRSTHFPDLGTLKRGLSTVLREAPGLSVLACEGDRHLASIWKQRLPRGTKTLWMSAEDWRERLLTPSERRDALTAKRSADRRARQVIEASGLARPTSLRHDAAEAILIGLWACLKLEWTARVPWEGR